MPGNAPLSKSSELIRCLNALDWNDSSDANNFELVRIKREAKKLSASDAEASYVIQGIIAAYEENVDDMRSFHEKALRLGKSKFTLGNYATSLINTNFEAEAIEKAEEAYQFEPGSPEVIDQLIQYNFRRGRFDEVTKWFEQWQKEKPGEQSSEYEFYISAIKFAKSHEITASVMEKLIDVATSVLRENEIYKYDLNSNLYEDEDGVLSWILSLQLSVDEVADLTSKYTDKVLSLPDQLFALQFIDMRYESNPA